MTSMTFSPVEAAVLGQIREAHQYRSELEHDLPEFSIEEIEGALKVLQRHKLIAQWGGSIGPDRQFFLATALGVQLHQAYTTSVMMEWMGARRVA
jgi:hypothetical protein